MDLQLKGLRENNLKNLSLDIKHNELIVVTGVSGSGKSTLAFDTIYAEGGRRYIETFSPYTRQFLDRLHKPKLDSASGIRPSLALEQRNKITNSRSTVGTITEINDYLKIIWANLSKVYCPNCNTEIKASSSAETLKIVEKELQSNEYVLICFELPLTKKASLESVSSTLKANGLLRFFDEKEGKIKRIEEINSSNKNIFVIVDRIVSKNESHKRIIESANQAFKLGKNILSLISLNKGEFNKTKLNRNFECPSCSIKLPFPKESFFSFNSAIGACTECNGFGSTLELDTRLCIPNENLSIAKAAIACIDNKQGAGLKTKILKYFSDNIIKTPWKDLTDEIKNEIIYGSKNFPGLHSWFKRLEQKRHKMHVRVFLAKYRSEFTCKTCKGSRLKEIANCYKLKEKTISDIWGLTIPEAINFISEVESENKINSSLAKPFEEVKSRLNYLKNMSLAYLTLDRQTKTLSGGEFQRVNLTSLLGARLTNTTIVLDEPTIGLHPRDTDLLLDSIKKLKERNNTIVVVEHDTDVIEKADSIIDIGPLAGTKGGEIIFKGSFDKLLTNKDSLTAKYLQKKIDIDQVKNKSKDFFEIKNAKGNNLKGFNCKFPKNSLTCITGVSGSGKSTLVHTVIKKSFNSPEKVANQLFNFDSIKDIIIIDQSPIGKTPRSNPATYSKAWDIIREALASTDAATKLGLNKSSFSFNVDGGRCPVCKGAGQIKVEMQFLADAFVQCDACEGSRFKDSVISIKYRGKSVLDFLNSTLEETEIFFKENGDDDFAKKVNSLINPLIKLGLGYLRLGHPLSALSGGEAQRVKLASYLSDRHNSDKYLFILDEPSTGLHPHNIVDLLNSLNELTSKGHSILCVEHNLELIAKSDYIIDLGKEGGAEGGNKIAEGYTIDLLQDKKALKDSLTIKELKRFLNANENSLKKTKKLKQKKHSEEDITVLGAKEHNLKNIDISIPKNKLTVITGPSGSGKSTLAFDIIFAEGQRRFIDCLSPYARQYIKQLSKADFDQVISIPPTIAVSQKTGTTSGLTTVATITEIYQYLRLLFSKVGTQVCPKDGHEVGNFSAESLLEELINKFDKQTIFLFSPVISGRKGHYNELFNRALLAEISEARIDGKIKQLSEDLKLERHKLHWISLLVASININQKNKSLIKEALEQALILGNGTIEISISKTDEPQVFSTERLCPKCKTGYRELDPQDFSFRSKRGVCKKCDGQGEVTKKGKTEKCPECDGARIAAIGRNVKIFDHTIYQLASKTAPELLKFFNQNNFDKRLDPIVEPILLEVKSKLQMLIDIGLDYIELDRNTNSISGGETQRMRLARALGSPLSGVCYILDEPSIGLHPSEHKKMLETLFKLRDQDNTLIVVEHDEETIKSADNIIDIGPVGGKDGGNLVFSGSLTELKKNKISKTAESLNKQSKAKIQKKERKNNALIRLEGTTKNNLKNCNVTLYKQALNVVCGVSGSGKSSLIHGSLTPLLLDAFSHGSNSIEDGGTLLKGLDGIDRFIEIDQSPVGKTSSSTPASYLGIFDEIRKVYANTPEAKVKGWKNKHFSYNTGAGKCSECSGKGYISIPMSFLPSAVSECETCNGLRYNEETLEITYNGISIGELLLKTMGEVKEIFKQHYKIRRSLEYVEKLGISYLQLGQATHTLSGGEVQRLKIAKEFGSREATNTLYILDEPSIGLHMDDVKALISVLNELISLGNTLVVIEHDLDFIREADHLIELGPKAGKEGGYVVFEGSPYELANSKIDSQTRKFLCKYSPR